MSKHTSNGSDGSDGSWFLEAVGAKERPPSPSEAVADLTAENALVDVRGSVAAEGDDAFAHAQKPLAPIPDPSVHMAFDGDPGTSTSSFHPVPAAPPPPEVIAPQRHDPVAGGPPPASEPPTEPAEAIDDTQLSPALRTRRNFRWPVVIVLVALIAIVGVAAWWLPKAAADDALAVRQSYYDAAVGVRNHLPEAQQALDAVTNPASDPEAIASSVPIIAELESRAFALASVTSEPLPTTLPLVPTDEIDALVPLRDAGAILGGSSSDLARRMANAYVFRTSIPTLLDTGPLPVSATTQEVNEISVRLASSLAEDAGIVADLPSDPTFDAVGAAALSAVERYAPWQDAYLEALTGEDVDAATTLVAEMDTMRADLYAVNDDAILAFRSEADVWIVDLAGDLEAYMNELIRG
jgi:hypothetical protein